MGSDPASICLHGKYLVANAALFDSLFHRFVMRRVQFSHSNFSLWLHGDVDVRWSRGLLVLELHWRDCGYG